MNEFNTMIPIPGRRGLYATDTGLIFSCNSGKMKQLKVHGFPKRKYLTVSIANKKGVYCPESVHRLVLEAFIGECPKGMETRHLNGNSHDNRLSNLAWGTRSQNAFDRNTHGTSGRNGGERCPLSKLTEEKVLAIRAEVGMTHQQLVDKYHTSISNVFCILHRKTWRHI